MSTSREEMERIRTEAELTQARLREQGREAGYRARQGAEETRGNVAAGLHTAAERLREQGQRTGRSNLMTRVAEPLDRSAQYLETHSMDRMGDDIARFARENPAATAAGVFVTAFLLGRLLRR